MGDGSRKVLNGDQGVINEAVANLPLACQTTLEESQRIGLQPRKTEKSKNLEAYVYQFKGQNQRLCDDDDIKTDIKYTLLHQLNIH